MINKCPCCNSIPVEAGLISCQNIKCPNYDEKYFVWEWQKLPRATDSLCEQGSAACIESLEFNHER